MPSLLRRTQAALKAFHMVFSGRGGGMVGGGYTSSGAQSGNYILYGDLPAPIPNTNYGFRTSIGDLWKNASVMACLAWVQRNFPEAPLCVKRETADGDAEVVKRHPLAELIRRPNPYYSGDVLWQGTLLSYLTNGNGYWLTDINRAGEVVGLWYTPHTMLRPIWPSDGSRFLSHYIYRVDGKELPVEPDRVIHFRFGFDLYNLRLGYSPLLTGLPEVDTLNEGVIFHASLLRKKGVVGGILWNEDPTVRMSPEKADKLRRRYDAMFTGDERGGLMVPDFKGRYEEVGSGPEKFALDRILALPQDTVCALLGIPPMVVGLTSGAEHKTYANAREARKSAYENCVKPTKGLLACDLNLQLLPGFQRPGEVPEFVDWDWSKVSCLQEEVTDLWTRAGEALDRGGITQDEFRTLIGFKALKPEQQQEIAEYLKLRHAKPGLGGGGFGAEGSGGGPQAVPESPGDLLAQGRGGTANGRPFAGAGKALAAGAEHWVTIQGHAVLIDGEGQIVVPEKEPSPSAKSVLAKQSAKLTDKTIQRYSEEHNEPVLAKGLAGEGYDAFPIRDNKPADVVRTQRGKITDGVELKTMVQAGNDKITMKRSAMEKKAAWMRENGADFHTVVFDDRKVFNAHGEGQHGDLANRVIYYRRGYGSFRVTEMHRATDMAELRRLIELPAVQLPAAAQASARALPYQGFKAVDGLLPAS